MSTVSPTDSLPPEILLKIFHLLSPRHLKRVVLVCRWWRKVGEDPALWGWVSLTVTRDNLSSMPEMLDTRRLETAPCLLVWHGVTVSDQLLQAVGRHSGLKTLNLVNTNLTTEQWEDIFAAISGGEAKLKTLDIEFKNNLSTVRPELLASAVTKLVTVNISCTVLTGEQCEALFTAINEGSQLRSLNIALNNLSTVTPLLLATAVPKLETVNVSYTGLTSEQGDALFSAINVGSQLRSLKICGNNLAAVTPLLLATAVTKMEIVDIRCTELTSEQCKALFTAINEGSQLRSLDIGFHNLSTVTPLLLATAVPKLEIVDISYTELTSEQCDALFSAINEGSQLRSLQIRMNNLSTVSPLLLATVESKLETDIRIMRSLTDQQREAIWGQVLILLNIIYLLY